MILGTGLLVGCPGAAGDGGQSESGDSPTTSGSTTFQPGQTVTSGNGNGNGSGNAEVDDGRPDDTADDSAFVVLPDGGVTGQCDPYEQDCPEGEKCTSYVSTPGGATVDATKCVPIIGDDLWGEPCERMEENDTCAPGFFCMTDVSGNTGTGTCMEYCSIDQPCENGGMCFPFNDGNLPVCEVTCDPILQDCPPTQGCYAAFNDFICALPGAEDGLGNDGDPCNTIQSCNPGLICRVGTAGCADDSGCCTPVCELSGDPICEDPSEECIQALEDPPPGLTDVGYCGVPA